MILFCIKVGVWIKKKTAKMRPSIDKGGLIIVSLLVRHRPVLSHAKQSDNSLVTILAYWRLFLPTLPVLANPIVTLCQSHVPTERIGQAPYLLLKQWWQKQIKSSLTLLLLSINSESSTWIFFVLLLISSGFPLLPLFGFLVSADDKDGEDESKEDEEDEDFLFSLTFLSMSSSSWNQQH